MTQISRYVIDDKVTGSDKWIGSDAQTQYTTKNFTPTKLAVYFNENQVIDIGTPIRYRYDILEIGDTRLPGTITFEPQVGTPYSLSSISSFILSKYTLKGNDVTQYLNFLIGSNVLIYKADDINIFGLYKVVSLVENIDEPNFFDVVVSYTTGNGSIVEDKDYLVSLIDIPGGDIPTKTSDLINDGEDGVHPFITAVDIPTPNLNDVLLEGNTSLLDAKIGEVYLYDQQNSNYAKISIQDDVFLVSRAGSGTTIFEVDDGEVLTLNNGIAEANIINNLTTNRSYTLPDASGTFALTSDLSTYVPYTGATGDINIGNNSIYTAGGAKLWDDGTVEGQTFQFLAFNSYINAPVTAFRNWTLPNASGTIALTSDLSTYVPYTGATGPVNLGAYDLTVNSISVGRGAGTGNYNTAVGDLALSSNTTGEGNIAIGYWALKLNTTATNNVAIGYLALQSVITGAGNVGIGSTAGLGITTGSRNNFIGLASGQKTTTGYGNNFLGDFSGYFNTTGSYNVAIGSNAGFYFNTGEGNVALGAGAAVNNTSGSRSIFIGQTSGQVTSTNANATNINNSILIGYNTKPFSTPSANQIVIGDSAIGIGDNTVTLGNTLITTTRLRGAVQGGSFVKDGGASTQFLMGDGSVTIGNGGVYSYEIHVSQVDGNDITGTGALLNPVATITKALTLITGLRRTIVIHPGNYTENPNVTFQYTVLTTYAQVGGNTLITGTISTNTGCTISGLKMTNLNITAPTGQGNVNILNYDVSGTLTKSSTGDYTLIRFTDIGATNITSSAGLIAIFGGNPNFITINNSGARVIVKNAVTVAPVLISGNANFVDCIIIATTGTSNAITTSAGTIVTLANSQIVVPTFNNVARVSLSGFYSIFNTVFDKPNSFLIPLSSTGGTTNSIDYFQFINADKFIKQGGTSLEYLMADGSVSAGSAGTVTSVGLSMPTAFSVSNSPITGAGTIAVAGAGTASQYIRGDGTLATLPSSGGGGSSVNYYLNGSINSSVATYKQLSNTAVIGAGTDFQLIGNGLISQFLTDLGNPNRTEIPGGAWNFEMFFSMSSNGGTPAFYVELLKYDGTTFTSIASNSTVPENITGGTSIDLYLTSLAVPTTPLLVTDRLAIRVYIVNNSGGRTATLHTEDSHLCEIITTFSGGVTSLNGLTANTQYFAVGTSGTDFNISSITDTHTFNLPTASAINRGALSFTDWSAFNNKQNALLGTGLVRSTAGVITYDTNNYLTSVAIDDIIATGTPNSTNFLRGDGVWDKGFTWFSYVVGKTGLTETTVIGGVVQTLSYIGTTEKRYRFIGSPYDSATDIIYTTFSGGILSNPIAYKLITL